MLTPRRTDGSGGHGSFNVNWSRAVPDLSQSEQEAMEAVIAWPISRAPVQDAFQAGWLAARDFYGQQLRDLESEIVREHIGEQAVERERELRELLVQAREVLQRQRRFDPIKVTIGDAPLDPIALGLAHEIGAALAASPETEAHDV